MFNVLIQKDWAELKAVEFWGSFAGVTGASRQFLDNAAIIPRLFRENPQAALLALQEFGCQNRGTILGATSVLLFASVQSIAQYVGQWRLTNGSQPNPRLDPRLGIGVAVIGGIALAVGSLIAWDELTRPSEFRLTGFDRKVGTLAEHLAKVLDREIAGYPRPDPNPENRATRVWCVTIRRVLEEIDKAGYSEKQLNRDLEAIGISKETWDIIKDAVKDAAKVCDDHWGNFTGGSLATS